VILPALSLSQPWAEMVLGPCGKNIENRTWDCKKRGTFLIHAAQGMTRRGYDHAYGFAVEALGRLRRESALTAFPLFRDMQRGGIVGAAQILDVVNLERLALKPDGHGHERAVDHPAASNPWLMDGCYGFVLGGRTRLPFRPYKGAQRWFNVEPLPDEVELLRAAGLLPEVSP
jgi:hypothetical protein